MSRNQVAKQSTQHADDGALERLDGVVAMLGTLDAEDDDVAVPQPDGRHAEEDIREPTPVAAEPEPAANVDPVRMYLRQMASVALLTRDGEVEIARRIEDGERDMVHGALGCPYALHRVLALGERLRAGEVKLRDLVRDEAEEEGEPVEDDETHRRRFLRQLATIRHLAEQCDALTDGSTGRQAHDRRSADRRARLRRDQARLLSALCRLGLNRRQIEQIMGDLDRAAARCAA